MANLSIASLQGRVNTHEVFGLSNSDLVRGKYEGIQDSTFSLSLSLVPPFCGERFSKLVILVGDWIMLVDVCGFFLGAGGLKLWEGSLDLVKALQSEVKNGNLTFCEKRVLEVGS